MTVILLSTLYRNTCSGFCGIDSNEIFAADLIKKQELEKDELRPLYMDFQATTPMVTSTEIHLGWNYLWEKMLNLVV